MPKMPDNLVGKPARPRNGKGKQRKLEAAAVVKRSNVEQFRAATEHHGYAELLLDPMESELVRQPSLVPCRGTIIRDKQIFDLTGVSAFYVEARPSLDRTVAMTSPSAGTASTGAWYANWSGELAATAWISTPFRRVTDSSALVPQTQGTATPRYAMTTSGAGNITVRITNPLSNTTSVAVSFSEWPGGATTTSTYAPPGSFASVTVAISATMGAFSVGVVPLRTLTPQSVSAHINIDPGALSLTPSQVSNEVVHNITLLSDVASLRYYKIVAQELLVSYTGSDQDNGGVIAGARVSGDWSFDGTLTTDAYDAIADIPYDNYDGRLKSGCHVHWSPNSTEDLAMQYPGKPGTEPRRKLVVGGRLDDTTQSIRVRVTTIVEYFTDSPSYGAMTYGPPWADFDVYMAMLDAVVPAATENDKHVLTKIKRGLGKVAKWAQQRAKEELRNPANWATLASMLL